MISIQSRKNEETGNIAELEKSLFDSYSIFYQKQPVYLGVYQQDIPLNSTLPDLGVSFDSKLSPDQREFFLHSDKDQDYLIITGKAPQPFDNLLIVYCYNLTKEIKQWNQIAKQLLGFAFILSLLLSIILYLILSYIFKPLTQITGAAEKIAMGDYDNKIHIQGKGEIAKVADILFRPMPLMVLKLAGKATTLFLPIRNVRNTS